MWLYLLIFFIPVGMYAFSPRREGRNAKRLAAYLAGLAIFVGLGDMLGGFDRYIYGEVFDTIADVTNAGGSYWEFGCFNYFPSEPGYILLNIFISFFTENRYIFIFIITLLIYTLLFISLWRYASNYPFALILFLGLWFFFSFTYLRQVLGATLAWLSIPYIVNKKFWKFLLITLLAMTLHKSAIIFSPVYFLGTRSYSRKQILWLMAILLVIGISPIPNTLFTIYGDVSEVEIQRDYNASGGFRIAYLLEAALFLWLLLRSYVEGEKDMTRQVLFNIALLFCATLLLFIRSENGGRLSWYFMIGIICTLTSIATRKINRRTIAPLLVVICLGLYIRIYVDWQNYLNLSPYKTFLTNGYRTGDYSWENYEYDHKYDTHKMYRKPFRLKINL